jgi:hypothetical protein
MKLINSKPAEQSAKQGTSCLAYGCPLPASMSSHTDGEGKWYCRHHFGKSTMQNDQITFAIKANLWMAEIAERMINAPKYFEGSKTTNSFDVAFENMKSIIKEQGRMDLMPKKVKNRHGVEIDENQKRYLAWANRITGAFDNAIYEVAGK